MLVLNSKKFLNKEEDLHLKMLLQKERNRNTLILSMLRHYGMRASELLSLRPIDINHVERSIHIVGLKGSKERTLPLTDEFYERLQEYVNVCPSDEIAIFGIGYRRLVQIWNYWRPCRKKLHALRHTCAVELYMKTKDIKLVQMVLGHLDIRTTMIYQDFTYSQEEFKKVFLPQVDPVLPICSETVRVSEPEPYEHLQRLRNYVQGRAKR